ATGSAPGMEALALMAHSGLSIVDSKGIPRARLAEEVPSLENGLWKLFSDGRMETTWKIRPNAEWHDGTPFTSEDLRFTYAIEEDKDLVLFGHAAFRFVESVNGPDPRTVTVRWKQPAIHASLLFGSDGDRSVLPLPKHLLQRAYIEDKPTFLSLPYWTTEYVGAGPYRLSEWVADSHAIFVANDRYPLGRPKIDEIEVRFIRDLNTLAANLLAGAVDVSLGRTLSLDLAEDVVSRVGGAKMVIGPSGTVFAYPQFVSPDPPILGNLQFRRALLQAVDRQQMVESLLNGRTSIAHTFISPSEPDYPAIEASIVKYPYDPRVAGEMIDGLGYARGADGGYRDAAGQRLSLELRGDASGAETSGQATLALADAWKRAGVGVELHTVPRQRQGDLEYRATYPGLEMSSRGNYRWDLARVLGSSGAAVPENGFLGGNRGRYMNAGLDALIDGYESTIPLSQRNQLLGQIVRQVSDQVVLMGMLYTLEATVHLGRLQNVDTKLERSTQVWNVHEWEVQ
ncbi:MAG: hypothetical protein HW416_3273, partial [Chloroflexi bacterium]|nr:hypothetical protein [Chloroflexota bacterium]